MRYRFFIPYSAGAATEAAAFSFRNSHRVSGDTPYAAALAALEDSGPSMLAPRFALIADEPGADSAYELYLFDVKRPLCPHCDAEIGEPELTLVCP